MLRRTALGLLLLAAPASVPEPRHAELAGQVTTSPASGGQPVPDAELSFFRGPLQVASARADPQGRFRLRLRPGGYRVQLRLADQLIGSEWVEVRPGSWLAPLHADPWLVVMPELEVEAGVRPGSGTGAGPRANLPACSRAIRCVAR